MQNDAELGALAVSPTATANGPNAWAILLPILMIGVTVLLVIRLSRRTSPTQRDSTSFRTIMPAAPAADGQATASRRRDRTATPSVRLADVAGCDEAKLELTETIEFLRSPERVPQARRPDPARHHAVRPARHRQDDARPRGRRGGRRPVPPRVRARSSWRSTSASARSGSASCSPRPASSVAASSSSTSSTRSARPAAARTATRSGSRPSTSCSSSSTASARPTTSSSSPRRTGSTRSTRRSSGRAASTARSTSGCRTSRAARRSSRSTPGTSRSR